LRLFILSVIWRAAISNLSEFSLVSIGPYTDIIRDLIYEDLFLNKNKNQKLNIFKVIISRYSSKKPKVIDNIIQNPYTLRSADGINMVCLFLPKSFKLYLKMDKRDFDQGLKVFDIDSQVGFVPILPLGQIETSGDYQAIMNAVHNSKNKGEGK
jgi:hypothetical protein